MEEIMASKVDAIPKGYHTITPNLVVKNANSAIDFYKKAFGAIEKEICLGPDGKSIMHAELKIGDSIVMLNDEFPDMGCVGPQSLGGTSFSLYLYVDDVDTWHKRAVTHGATVSMPVTDMFWGDRFGQIIDPFGHRWSLATHTRDMTPEEIKKEQEAWQKQMASCNK
jgi:uncharacterized glyoxalase superfamily protein PhnB